MVGVSVIQVANAVRHTPLPSLVSNAATTIGADDSIKGLESPAGPHHVLGGFVGGGQLAWRAAGPTVEIIEPDRGTRKAAWTFGAVLHNSGAQVTSVCGVGKGLVTHVVVGVDMGADRRPRGLVALLSLRSSRVTRAFHFEHKVTKLCMVSGGEVSVDSGTLAPELRHWHGLLVVSTAHGTLHLLDLALDLGCHKVISDEVSPGSLLTMATPDPTSEHTRVTALRQQCHPTMCLSDGMSYNGRFQLIGPDDNVLFEVASHQVFVTALAFFPQLASLVVGYNFGAFQIINLSTLTIDCASPYEENMPPVLSFACQEPENDPKNFVYLWLCRSQTSERVPESNKTARGGQQALCTMYAMSYDSKVWIEGHGLWYQGLASISPRFEFDVLGGLGLKGQPVGPSRVFTALTVQLTTPPGAAAAAAAGPSPVAALSAPDEDSGTVLEQSLCLFGWVGGVMEKDCVSLNHYLAVFDINQWYQAHMPSTLKLEESQLCPFMSFHLLDLVPGLNSDGSVSEMVLGAVPKPASWAQHTSHTCNDSDWFPAALSYDAHVLSSDSLVEYRCQSAQQAALALLTSCGPAAIVSPEEAHAVCVFAGLIPAESHHSNVSSAVSSMMLEREALLNVALDQQLVSLLVQCVVEFSEGRFTNLGCSLPSLLDWAWAKVAEIKASSDSLCLPLFDSECGVVSSDTIALLHQNLTSLTTLNTIVTTIRDHAHSSLITLQGAGELEGRVRVVQLVVLHLGAVLWFYHCGLLTSNPIEDPSDECSVPFPAELLSRIYRNRRMEISSLSTSLYGSEILMIDGLLEEATEESGGRMGKAWEEEEAGTICSRSKGMYPPPSLHALLNMFLLPDVPTTTKHRIVQYLFLDLASLLSDGYVRIVEELVKYPSSFSLSPSLIKLTQAFWLLDHKDFQEGLNVLLDPLVNPCDITPWQHRRIMKAFLYQGEHGRALTYAKMRQPPKADIDDIRLHLTLLLANGLVREAFHYQRSHRTTANTEDLLQHFFTGCEQQGRLESVIHLPLSPLEESALVNYLHASASTAAHDYLLVYYLQRARYDDAALLQDGLRGGLGTARRRHGARSALVHGYLTHLPDVARRLSSGAVKRSAPAPTLYKKPPPLSAQIRQSIVNAKSRATSLEHQLSSPPRHTDPFTPFKTAAQRRRAYELSDLDNYEVLVTPRKKESRDASHVVFPTSEDFSSRSLEGVVGAASSVFSPAPAKRSRLTEHSLLGDSILKAMESVVRRTSMHTTADIRMSFSQNISADMLSLLETPKVKRRRRPESRPNADGTLTDTPQSILKVRQMVQRPLSPSAASDASVPVFPRLSARKAKISAAATAAIAEESAAMKRNSLDTSLTPKQLRFHLPKVQTTEELKIKGVTRLSAAINQPIDEDEEETAEEEEAVEALEEEEEQQEEEEVENEVKEDEEGTESHSTQDLKKEVQTAEGRKSTLSFVLERHEEDLGVPTPRQPLHGLPTDSPSTCLSQESQETKKLVFGSSHEEEQEEEAIELPSRETSFNDMFYSFEEEQESGTAKKEEEGKAVPEMSAVERIEDESEDKKEKHEDREMSMEFRKIHDVTEGEGEEQINAEEEMETDHTPETISYTDEEETEHHRLHSIISDVKEKMEREEKRQREEKDKEEEEESRKPSIGNDEFEKVTATLQTEPGNPLISSVMSEIAVPQDKEAPTHLPGKEDNYSLWKPGEGLMKEDEGFSEQIEPPTEAVEEQEVEVEEEVEISSPVRLVLPDMGKGYIMEGEEKLEAEVEADVEVEISTPERLVLPEFERNVQKVLESEEKSEKEEEERVQAGEEVSTEEEKDFSPLLNIIESTSKIADENTFNLDECVSGREKEEEEDIEHCITSQEEEMIAEAISDGAEELYLKLSSDNDMSPGLSTGDDNESKDLTGENEAIVTDVNVGQVKISSINVEEDTSRAKKANETFVVYGSNTQQSSEEIQLVSSMSKEPETIDTKLTVEGNESGKDDDKEITEVEDAGPVMKENTELYILSSAPVEEKVAKAEGKQLNETFMVEERQREVLSIEKEHEQSKKMERNVAATSSSDQGVFTVVDTPSDFTEQPISVSEVDEARPITVEVNKNDEQEEFSQSAEAIEIPVTKDILERAVEMVDETSKQVPPSDGQSGAALTESGQEPPTSTSEEKMVVEDLSDLPNSTVPSSVSIAQENQDPAEHIEKSLISDTSSDHTEDTSQLLTPRRSARHTPIKEQLPISLRRTRRQSETSNSSAPPTPKRNTRSVTPSREEVQDGDLPTSRRRTRSTTPLREEVQEAPPTSRRSTRSTTPSREEVKDAPPTPKRSTRSTTPLREEMQDAFMERVTRSGRKIVQVPTPLLRSKGTPRSPLPTPGSRLRRLSGSQEADIEKVSQKLHLTPENKAEEKDALPSSQQEELGTAATPSMAPTPQLATPTRRSTRRSQVEALETISENSEVERLKSEGRARTPSRDTTTTPTTTTPSKATPRRSRRSAAEPLETIAEDAVLTPTTPRRSARRSMASQSSDVTLGTPKKRRASIESESEEASKVKTPRRTRQSSGDTSKATLQKRTPGRRKKTQPDTPTEEGIHEADEGSSSSALPEKDGSIASRTRRRSISEGSTREGERGRLSSLTSIAESLSTSPARSTPLTSIKDSESSEDEDRKIKKQEESIKSKQGVKGRKSRLLIHTSALQPLHVDLPKSRRESIRTMKLYKDSEENDKYVTDSEKKYSQRICRTRKSSAAAQFSPSSSPVLLLRSGEKSETETEREIEGVELEAGLTMEEDEDVFVSSGASSTESQEDREMELSLLKVGEWNKSRKTRKSVISMIKRGRKKEAQKRRTLKLPHDSQTITEDEGEDNSQAQDADKKTARHISKTGRKSRATKQSSCSSSPLLLLNIEGKEANVKVESSSDGVEEETDPDNDRKEEYPTPEVEPQESSKRKQSSQGRGGKKRGKGKGRGSSLHSGKEDESNTITTTTTSTTITTVARTRRSTQSEQRLPSVTKATTQLDVGLSDKEENIVGEERLQLQLLGKEEDGRVVEESMEGQEGGGHRKPLEIDIRSDSDGKEAVATTPVPQFKFAKPKPVSSKRQMRALEDLTNEAVNFLFSLPLAAGRNAKEKAKTEKGSSSSESEIETKNRRTSHKKH